MKAKDRNFADYGGQPLDYPALAVCRTKRKPAKKSAHRASNYWLRIRSNWHLTTKRKNNGPVQTQT